MALNAADINSLALIPAPGGESTCECPFCGGKRGHFYVNLEKQVYFCHRCGAKGRIVEDKYTEIILPPRPRRKPERRPKPERTDRVYNALLSVLQLSPEDWEHLMSPKRGLTKEAIDSKCYRTMPMSGRVRIANEVASKTDVEGIPGFYLYDGKYGATWCLSGNPGILIPVRDFERRIRGLQIRSRDAQEVPGETASQINENKSRPRYTWLSSAGKSGGMSASTYFHVAYPCGNDGNASDEIWITEGPLKADISANLLNRIVIAVPGVNTWRSTGLIEALKQRSPKRVVLAFDADKQSNPYVQKACDDTTAKLSAAGLNVFVADWQPYLGSISVKGLDDLLLVGKFPRVSRFSGGMRGWTMGNVNRAFLSGVVAELPRVTTIKKKDGSSSRKVFLKILQDKYNEVYPVSAIDYTADKLLEQNPRKGDHIYVEGRLMMSRFRNDEYMEFLLSEIHVIKINRAV